MDNTTTAVIGDHSMIINDLVLGGWRQRAYALPASAVRGSEPMHASPCTRKHENTIDSITVMGGVATDDFGTPWGPRPGRPPV